MLTRQLKFVYFTDSIKASLWIFQKAELINQSYLSTKKPIEREIVVK